MMMSLYRILLHVPFRLCFVVLYFFVATILNICFPHYVMHFTFTITNNQQIRTLLFFILATKLTTSYLLKAECVVEYSKPVHFRFTPFSCIAIYCTKLPSRILFSSYVGLNAAALSPAFRSFSIISMQSS